MLLSYLSALSDKHASMGLSWNHICHNLSVMRMLSLIKCLYIHKSTKKAKIITRTYLRLINNQKFSDDFNTLPFYTIAFVTFYGLTHLEKLIQSSLSLT